MADRASHTKIIRVGLIGCGDISQVSHISALGNLSDYFQITYLCDVSQKALGLCVSKVHGPKPRLTNKADEVCSSKEVDAVLIANATSFHVPHAVLALQNNKPVLVEKPLALCYRDIEILQAAEQKSSAKLFVGYMRRYAPGFLQAMSEIGDRSKIQYARVRDIIGLNSFFIEQSGTFPKRFDDTPTEDLQALTQATDDINEQALHEFDLPLNDQTIAMLGLLGNLGSHDLSAMREVLGMPKAVVGARLGYPIWTALLDYGTFSVVYESGINDVPVFDAHIEIYTSEKILRVNYDTPFVKGLPTTVTVREKIEGVNGEVSFQERNIRTTYEDSYTVEFREWYECIVTGEGPKTSIADAKEDIDLIKMLLQAGFGTKS